MTFLGPLWVSRRRLAEKRIPHGMRGNGRPRRSKKREQEKRAFFLFLEKKLGSSRTLWPSGVWPHTEKRRRRRKPLNTRQEKLGAKRICVLFF